MTALLPQRYNQLRAVVLTEATVKSLFRSVDVADLLAFHDAGHVQWVCARKHANLFLREAATWRWVPDQNILHGVAPSAEAVYTYCWGAAAGSKRSMRRWDAAWRKRWSVRRGALRPQVPVDVADMQAKAGLEILGNRRANTCSEMMVSEAAFDTSAEVRCFWKLLAYRARKKEVLWLNLDETSIPFSTASPTGCVAHKRCWPAGVPPRAKVRAAARRGCFTYCAIVCSDASVQPCLPHFLVGTETTITKKLVKAYQALPASKLQILRRKTAWVTSADIVLILRQLASAWWSEEASPCPLPRLCPVPHHS